MKIYFIGASYPSLLSLATPSHCTLGNFFANCRNFFHIFSWWASCWRFSNHIAFHCTLLNFFANCPLFLNIYFLDGTSCPAGFIPVLMTARVHALQRRPRCRSGLCPRPCYVARLFAVFMAVERYAVFKVLRGSIIYPSIYQPPHASAQTDNYFCKVLKIVEILRFVVNNAAPFFLFRTRDTVSRVSGSCMVSHCLMPNFSMP